MNLVATLAKYARLLAPRLPLATAARLSYEHQDDYTALAKDLSALQGGHHGVPVSHEKAIEFLTRCAALVALSARPLNAPRWDVEAQKAAREERAKELMAGYVALLGLVPTPEDTGWVRASLVEKRWTRTLSGYSLEVTHHEKSSARYGSRAHPAYYRVGGWAPGVGYITGQDAPAGTNLAGARKLAESLLTKPILEARKEMAASIIRGDR